VTRAMTKTSVVWAAIVAVAQTLAAQPATRLRLQMQDYAEVPITGELDGQNTRGLLARDNFLRDEPGGRRFFVNDLNGPLYILDKKTREFATYLAFNGRGDRPGMFDKLPFEAGFANGFISFQFDPDYRRNGRFYTIHLEQPSVAGSLVPDVTHAPGLIVAGYTATAPIATPGEIEREAILIEWTDSNVANVTFEGTAREVMRL
jgi:hypothetical protein